MSMRLPWNHLILAAGLAIHLVTGSHAADENAPLRDLSWQKTPSALALLHGKMVVWQFNHLADGKEPGCPYFHPLATMDGTVLTDRQPRGHPWHRGLRFAWKKINGVEGYWTWPEGQERWPEKTLGRTAVTAVKVHANPDFSARFELQLDYHPPGAAADVTEKRVVEVSAPDEHGHYRIDWHGVFTAGAKDAVLDRTPIPGEEDGKWFGGYAGLQFRVAHSSKLSSWTVTNSEGVSVTSRAKSAIPDTRKSLQPLHGQSARWMALTLNMADGQSGGVMIMDHPKNLRHPCPWHLSAMPHEFHHAPLFHGPHTLAKGNQLPFRFRILIHGGAWQESELAAQWTKFVEK